ncbi:MAG: DUF4440 domain-containing protein [Robiginitomaculum sp.]|nr:MAG: DUF4440 domain-containing protein [Robiginitomaculum sp.]
MEFGKKSRLAGMAMIGVLLISCAPKQAGIPSFQTALNTHLATIADRDLQAYTQTLTKGDGLPLVFPDGGYLATKSDVLAMHADWFADKNWRMTFEPVSQIVGKEVAVALIKTSYRDTPDGTPRYAFLTLSFQLQEGEWRLVLDQNTRIIQN